MATGVSVRMTVMEAQRYFAPEVLPASQALFDWLGKNGNPALFLTATDALTEAGANHSAAVDTNLVLIEASSPAAATTGVFIQAFSVALANVTLGTTVPIVSFRVPVNDRVVVPCFGLQNGRLGFRSVTRLSVFATTIGSISGAPSAAVDQPIVRTVALDA